MTGRTASGGRHWAAVGGLILVLGSAAAPVAGADPPARHDPSAGSLLGLYRERYRRDAEAHARLLNGLDAEIRKRVLSRSTGSLWDAVSYAIDHDAEARRGFEALLALARLYNGWALKAGLPAEFAVRGGVGSRRREAIRPLLLPLLGDAGRAEWQDPDRDSLDWRDARAARLYEFLMLLRASAGAESEAPARLAWAGREVGAESAVGWTRRAGGRSAFLHGRYAFETVAPPDPSGTPARVRAVLDALRPRPGTEAEAGPLKDEFLTALLRLLARGDVGSWGADWFNLGGRLPPVFTAFRPQFVGGSLHALEERPGRTVRDLVGEAATRLDAGAARAVREGVFWPQVSGVDGAGRPRMPAVPWTGYVTAAPDETAVAPTMAAPPSAVATAAPTAGDLGPFPPESAWRETCEWVAGLRNRAASGPGSGPFRVAVENRTSTRIAFGAEELAFVLTKTPRPDSPVVRRLGPETEGRAPGSDLRVVVVAVDRGRSITVDVRQGGDRIGRRRVLVTGAWPAWFALGPEWQGWDVASGVFALAGLALAVTAARRTSPCRVPGGQRFGARGGLAAAALLVALWPLLRPGAVPGPAPGRGERIVFEVHSGRAIPGRMKDFTAAVCAEVCRELSRRFVTTAAAGTAARGVPEGVLELRYEVRTTTWRDGDRAYVLGGGRVRDATIGGIRAWLDRDDVSPDGEPTLPAALLDGPEQGVALVVVVHDGDHGSLRPPRRPEAGRDRPPVVSVWVPTPTRDGRAETGLDARSRVARLAAGSAAVLSPLRGAGPDVPGAFTAMADGSTIGTLDDPGHAPADLTSIRAAMWDFAGPADFDAFARSAGARTGEAYRTVRPATSRTALRRAVGPGDSLWPPATLSILTLLLWSRLPGMSARNYGRSIAVACATTVLVLLAPAVVPILATFRCEIWAFGQGVADGGRSAARVVAAAAGLALSLSLGAWALERRIGSEYGDEVRESATLFARRPPPPSLLAGLRGGGGLLLLTAGLVLWLSEPVAVGGAWAWLLPASERSCVYAGVGAWAVGIALLVPGPARREPPPGPKIGASRPW